MCYSKLHCVLLWSQYDFVQISFPPCFAFLQVHRHALLLVCGFEYAVYSILYLVCVCVCNTQLCTCICSTHVCMCMQCPHVCVCTCGVHRGQNRELDPLELELYICQSPCRYWELNPSPLEEQPILLTAEPSLQPPRGS